MNAKRAYSAAKAPTRTPKDLEFEAIARITHRMISASKQGPEGFSALAEALTENRKLWQIFQTDVTSADNGLPEDLKEQILYLAAFTTQYTSRILARKAGVGPLVEINTAIMRGLRSGAS
nr:flagellar biosynthesis regulator FlaF [Phycobacter azelaicus]